jgi:Zn ribbon nucleic-acid-binding protein
MAKTAKDFVPCPQCGEPAELPSAWRRDANLTMTCGSCGHVHLALNAVRLQVHGMMKARGFSDQAEPPTLLPIEPVQIFPLPDGKTEVVYRRNKRGGETMFTRKVKAKPKSKADRSNVR